MKCPYCGFEESKVVDKRDLDASIRRRRECLKCEKRYTTYEEAEENALFVIKKDGRRESFSREKLLAGVTQAFHKRPVPQEKMQQIVEQIEQELRKKEQREVASSVIGSMVIRRLKRIDKVAYIRFASVYKEFADLEEFQEELKKLLKK